MNASNRKARAAFLLSFAVLILNAETGKLLVQVKDAQRHPIRGVEIGIEGAGGSSVTGDDGKALLILGNGTAENDWVSLQILRSPAGKDLVMVSPWDYRVVVPSFKNKSENFLSVVVVQRGDRAALENSAVVANLAAKLINKVNASKGVNSESDVLNRKADLEALAREYGLRPDEVDEAIGALGARTTDPYEAGLAACIRGSILKRLPTCALRCDNGN